MTQLEKTIIGRVEKVKFPELDDLTLHARIDTGARTSSVGMLSCKETKSGLEVIFPSETSPEGVMKHFFHYDKVVVASSMGHQQIRFKVKLSIIMRKRRIRATFTLANRSSQVYPVLIGRSAVNHKFIVDVAKGSPLLEAEQRRSAVLQAKIISENKI